MLVHRTVERRSVSRMLGMCSATRTEEQIEEFREAFALFATQPEARPVPQKISCRFMASCLMFGARVLGSYHIPLEFSLRCQLESICHAQLCRMQCKPGTLLANGE